MNDLEALYTIDQTAAHWHVCRTSVFHWIKRYRIKTVKVGRRTLVPGAEIRRVDAEHLRDPAAA